MASPGPTPSESPDAARRPDHEITGGGWRRARAPWALRTGAFELIVIQSDWDATHPSPTREFKSRLLDLTTAPSRHGVRIRSS
jgi:hypothetical protein